MSSIIPYRRSFLGPRTNTWFDDFFSDAYSSVRTNLKLDVKDTGSAYTIDVDVPGVEKEDISLDLRDERLTISVTHSGENKDDTNNYIYRERTTSSLQRSVYLDDADADNISAKLENGVLRIEVQKQEKKKIRSIEIQ